MPFEKFNLVGKTALITGAAGMLGSEHAIALLECGARVVLTDIAEDLLNTTYKKLANIYDPEKVDSYVMNVAQTESISNVAKQIWQDGIRIDILINNAAIDPKVTGERGIVESSRLENFSHDQWSQQIAVGLTGAFFCSQIFGSAMADDLKGGVILNIASDLSVFSPDQRLYRKQELPDDLQPVKPVTYSVIKSGLIGLTRYLSTYWADKNIRCNALSPGGVFDGQSDEFVKRISSLIPLGRMANRDEYQAAVQFLCSDASSYMNGQNLVIDGGRSTW